MRKHIAVLVLVTSLMALTGCRTTGLHSVINPIYEAKVNELAATKPVPAAEKIEEALEGIPKWLDKEKMDMRGVGKNEVDFDKDKIKNDSGFKVPFGDTSVQDLQVGKD